MCRAVMARARDLILEPQRVFFSFCCARSVPAGPCVVLSDLSFSWPNGRGVLDGLSAAFSPGRTGLIGVNGAGKSTLLALIAGQPAAVIRIGNGHRRRRLPAAEPRP